MAVIINHQLVQGVVILDEADGQTIFNSQPVVGVRAVDEDVGFVDNQSVRPVDDTVGDIPIWNTLPVLGVVVITDDRTMYNNQRVMPVVGLSPVEEE